MKKSFNHKITSIGIEPVSYKYKYAFPKGLSRKLINSLSKRKKESEWMREFRFKSYDIFRKKKLPDWGGDLSDIKFKDIYYYLTPTDRKASHWKDVPKQIKRTYEKLGIPQAEQKFLSGVSAQFESEVVYESILKGLSRKGVIFLDTDTALKKYPLKFKNYFGSIISPSNNKFAALNSAVWSGGSFIYIPKGVRVELPLQAYFLINAPSAGQFERTLIIADEGSFVSYIEGCTAPVYSKASLHAAVVEVIVKKNARVRYTTVQNWSTNVYNLTTKRARIEENGVMEWVDANIGSKLTMKYPSCVLDGEGARGELLSLSYAKGKQHQDSGGKMIHLAPKTSSRIISKSISKDGGRCSYRGLIHVTPKAKKSKAFVSCDAMILDKKSRTDTYPTMKVRAKDTNVQHEATVERIDDEKLFYLESRGVAKQAARTLIINGFIDPIVKEIPLEYAIEMNRLISLEMEEGVG